MISREKGQLKGRTPIGGLAVFELLVILSITKLYTHGITVSDICSFLITRILICKMLFFVKWKKHRFVFYLFKLLLLSLQWLFFLWNSQGDYITNSYINWWKLLIFACTSTSIENVSTNETFFLLDFLNLKDF